MKDDTISRQAAIDLWEKYHPTIAVDAMQYDAELRKLPSAQPEIIRCKDCKHYKQSEWLLSHMCCHYVIGSTVIRKSDDFCSRAERRTDAETEV